MVLQMLPGGSLQDRIDKHGILHPQQAIEAAIAMASGLGFAHEHNVVHRDIKLDNVLIGPDNELKVTDFGIAQVDGGSGMTKLALQCASGLYGPGAAQLRRATPISDLYSVGASLYVMLTNQNLMNSMHLIYRNWPLKIFQMKQHPCFVSAAILSQLNGINQPKVISALECLRGEYGPLPEDSIPFFVPKPII